LRESVVFGRTLRAAGLGVDLGAAIDFARALTLVDIGDRDQVRAAGAAVFVRRRDEREPYDRAFDRFWRRRLVLPNDLPPVTMPDPEPADAEGGEESEGTVDAPGDRQTMARLEGIPRPISDEGEDDDAVEGFVIAPDAYSASEVLRHREFDRMTADELRDAERLIDLLAPRLETRRTRRQELHRRGRRVAPRAMLRRNLATGGEALDWVWSRPTRRPRQIVVLCDISGSMERQSRLLLRFIQALAASNRVRTESFVFGTRLTRVTRLLRERDRDAALNQVADAVTDWAGGTRIGDSFRDFNLRWARRVLRTSGVVIVISDGWDRGDPALVASETARLQRNCHRLIWLNPLAGADGYEPLAAGMKAAYPYIDDFVAAGTLASLERLGELLAGSSSPHERAGRPRLVGVGSAGRRDRAAVVGGRATLSRVRASRVTAEPPRAMDGDGGDRTTARPLR
ncbi:MAG TPA: VWA domain-containing protein, partial [Candidatus Binatia bacterium]|nr:VWA domain-containing protein [Candidatus Binatia bacterium]